MGNILVYFQARKFPKETVGMKDSFNIIQDLLQARADYQARLNLIPYDGTPEIKENSSGKYLYVRKRIGGRLTSTYVDKYSEELYQLLLRNTKEARELKKQIRRVLDFHFQTVYFCKDTNSPDYLYLCTPYPAEKHLSI